MAQMNNTVITNKGQALMAKLIAGTATAKFTQIVLSSQAYNQSQLQGLTAIGGIKQTTLVSRITKTSATAIQVEGAITNTALNAGYHINTIGLYATDPQEGEILYSVTIATDPDYMPAYNGVTSTGIFLKLITTVSNSVNVSVDVDPAAVATVGDIQHVLEVIAEHKTDKMPHQIADRTNNKKYKLGLEIENGQPRLIYEEVTN